MIFLLQKAPQMEHELMTTMGCSDDGGAEMELDVIHRSLLALSITRFGAHRERMEEG